MKLATDINMISISVAADLAKYASTPTTTRRGSRRRRHSVSVCETPPSGSGKGGRGRKKDSPVPAAAAQPKFDFEPVSLPPIRGERMIKAMSKPLYSELRLVFCEMKS